MTTPIFWWHPLKNQWNNFKLSWICTRMQKMSSFHPFILHVWSILESCDQLATPIFDYAQPKMFWSTFNLSEFVSTWKKSGYVTDLFWRYVWFCNLIGWEHFGSLFRNKIFSQIWVLCRNAANNINFYYRTNSVKINNQFFE